MNNTIQEFEISKLKAANILNQLVSFLKLGEDAGIYIEDSLKEKIKNALSSVDSGKLKIVLIGGFSEGKTSIAAAWMERLDPSSMNISHQESSDSVKIYTVDNNCELIDTPGLFGFKEKLNVTSAQIEQYKDITKKYISEAHLVLYVMNSTNPIKASHIDDLNWLFKDLNLLSRTVFVLSRFDEIADIEDDWDYRQNYQIKKQNVIERLNDTLNLSPQEIDDISIAAVAANPFDMGTEYWLENIEKFKQLSHIDTLQNITRDKVKNNGGVMAVALEAQHSVIKDILIRQLPIAVANDEKIGFELEKLRGMVNRIETQMHSIDTGISEVRRGLLNFVTNHFSDLILQVKGTDMNTFGDFFEREIGNEGIVLNTRIQVEFNGQVNMLSSELNQLQANIANEVQHYNDSMMLFGKQGVNFVIKGNFINNKSILLARDGIVSTGKMIGIDLAGMLKFKPWGAVNLAKGINGALVFVGVAIEVWQSWSEYKKQKKFESAISEMVDNLEKQRKELIEIINGENFIQTFFPKKLELINTISDLEKNISNQEQLRSKFQTWRKAGEVIEGQFKRLPT
ncbi:LeoA/HP0731 family dynamin-like GTPase [Providencia rettgeri]|uniref:LeoA/HP0731 family dynamin-like GTPase n=1 Tax=Providencia rettgeri TaxID=587 RepID=UPI0023AA9DB3|nr:LeoA/HP0731 family dynamin-like GTPase [Providencia rettgeri]